MGIRHKGYRLRWIPYDKVKALDISCFRYSLSMGRKLIRIIKYKHVFTMLVMGVLAFVIDFGTVGKVTDAGSQQTIFVNGNAVGVVSDTADVEGMIREARRRLAAQSDELVLINCDIRTNARTDVFTKPDDDETVSIQRKRI